MSKIISNTGIVNHEMVFLILKYILATIF